MTKKQLGTALIVMAVLLIFGLTFLETYNSYDWSFLITGGPGSLLMAAGWVLRNYDEMMQKAQLEGRLKMNDEKPKEVKQADQNE